MNAYLTDTIIHVKSNGRTVWGEQLPPINETIRARVDQQSVLVEGLDGKQIIAVAKILLPPMTIISNYTARAKKTIGYEDKFIFDGATVSIARILRRADTKIRGIEVYVK